VKQSPFKDYLVKYVPTLEVKYWPTFWCFESRAQTVFASLLRASIMPDINYERFANSLFFRSIAKNEKKIVLGKF
jgi:abhydrolase domain-containing protein 1/3